MRYVAMRLFLIVFACTVILSLPIIEQQVREFDRPVATGLPIAGQSVGVYFPVARQDYPVAGQFIAGDDEEEEIEEPTGLILHAPITCEVGELVTLDATDSNVEGLIWQVIPNTPDFKLFDIDGKENRIAVFSAREPGMEFQFWLSAAVDGKPFLIHHVIAVEGEIDPNVTPQLNTKIKQWFKLVQTENRIQEARAVANVFRTLSTTDIPVDKILEATAAANREMLGNSLELWVPFLDKLGKELDAYIEGDKLGTKEQYAEVWERIADGLDAAAKE